MENEEKSKKGFKPRKFSQFLVNVINFDQLETFSCFFLYRIIGINIKRGCQEVMNFDHYSRQNQQFVYISVKCLLIYCMLIKSLIRDICSSRILETKGQTKP